MDETVYQPLEVLLKLAVLDVGIDQIKAEYTAPRPRHIRKRRWFRRLISRSAKLLSGSTRTPSGLSASRA